MHKQVLFQPCTVWYCHYHTDKTVGNAKAIIIMKDLPRPQKTLMFRQLSGNMTNNKFSSLHAHSEIVTFLEG